MGEGIYFLLYRTDVILAKGDDMNNKGQSMVEYLLLFAAVVAVLLIAVGPGGFVERAVDHSMDSSIDGFVSMANVVYQNAVLEQRGAASN